MAGNNQSSKVGPRSSKYQEVVGGGASSPTTKLGKMYVAGSNRPITDA